MKLPRFLVSVAPLALVFGCGDSAPPPEPDALATFVRARTEAQRSLADLRGQSASVMRQVRTRNAQCSKTWWNGTQAGHRRVLELLWEVTVTGEAFRAEVPVFRRWSQQVAPARRDASLARVIDLSREQFSAMERLYGGEVVDACSVARGWERRSWRKPAPTEVLKIVTAHRELAGPRRAL